MFLLHYKTACCPAGGFLRTAGFDSGACFRLVGIIWKLTKGIYMKFSVSIIVGVAVMAVFSTGAADELTDRYAAKCVADGDTQVACQCAAQAMQSTFASADFDQIVHSLEVNDHNTVEVLMETAFAAQPNLIDVFKAAVVSCEG